MTGGSNSPLRYWPFILAASFLSCSKPPLGVQRGGERITTYRLERGPMGGITPAWESTRSAPSEEQSANVRLSSDRNLLLVYHKWPPTDYVALDLRLQGVTAIHLRGQIGDQTWKTAVPVSLARSTVRTVDGACPEFLNGVAIKWPNRGDKYISPARKIAIDGKEVALRGRFTFACDGVLSPSRKYLAVRSMSDIPDSGVFGRMPDRRHFQILTIPNAEERFAESFGPEYSRTAKIEGWLDGSTYVFVYDGTSVDTNVSVEVQVIHLD